MEGKEERRGAGDSFCSGLATFPNLGQGLSRATVSAEQDGNKGQGGLPTKEKAGLRPGGVGTNHAALTGLPIYQESDWADATGCRVTAALPSA